MAETSGSGVPSTKTLSHRGAVLPFLLAGSRWELVSATTVCINSTFDLGYKMYCAMPQYKRFRYDKILK
ncbi:MAG: hypothetical protein IJ673_05545, partial [Treponema sp.]|nr:hypothetical protein [Treponema sp.]